MTETRHWIKTLVVTGLLGFPLQGYADVGGEGPAVPPQDGSISKTVLHAGQEVENLLKPTAWQAIEEGYRREVSVFPCDNGGDARGRRGVFQRVVLNQQEPQPIVASAWSKAEGVTGTIDSDYALYLDLVYDDGTELWGQVAGFRTGTHDWQREEVVLFPEKPIKAVAFNLLFRDHAGKAWFRDPELRHDERTGRAASCSTACPSSPAARRPRGSRSAMWRREAISCGSPRRRLGCTLDVSQTRARGSDVLRCHGSRHDRQGPGGDAAVCDSRSAGRRPLARRPAPLQRGRGRAGVRPCHLVPGRGERPALDLSARGPGRRQGQVGLALAIDMAHPAFYRIGYNAGTGELWIAYDLGLTPEKPEARLRFCRFDFAPAWGFRAALARVLPALPRGLPPPYRRAGPVDAVRQDQPGQGLGGLRLPVQGGQRRDGLGRRTRHHHVPLHRAADLVDADARNHAPDRSRRPRAKPAAWPTGAGARRRPSSPAATTTPTARWRPLFRDAPWNHGAVWSMNSMPGIAGEMTDFKTKWNPQIRERLYGPQRQGRPRRRVHRLQRGLRDRRARLPPRPLRRGRDAPGLLASAPIDRPSSAA